MKRNITFSGRVARAISGLLCLGGGVACWLNDWPTNPAWRWTLIVVAAISGLFQLYEARKAWCITRACGIKTPM